MPVAAADQPLYQLLSGAAPATIDQVVQTMESIDQLLPDGDGLKWFNRLYMMVTREVDLKSSGGRVEGRGLAASSGRCFCGILFSGGG